MVRNLGGVLLVLAAGCTEERVAGRPPPGESSVSSPSGAGGTTSSGGQGGADPTSGGTGGMPPLPSPADCACLAAVPGEGCRACVDAASIDGCASAQAACDGAGAGYCELVLDCIGLCAVPDAYCVDACLGAHDAGREVVEAFVACACGACAEACGVGSCG